MHQPHAPRNEPVNRRVGRWFNERPALQIVLCTGVYGLVIDRFGVMAIIMLAPLFAAAIARPVINLASNLRHRVRAHLLRDAQGSFYAYKGQAVHVVMDEDGHRWILLADVQKIIGPMATERALCQTYPDRLQPMGRQGHMHIRADALVSHLGKHHHLLVLRFRTWVERTLAVPGRHARPTLGGPATGLSSELLDDEPPAP